jgi:hypothetical protein
MRLTLKLTRPAKSKGGDRYESSQLFDGKPLVIYLPQEISRTKEGIAQQFGVQLEAE